jgi:aerobic carbon-monoxide dehydrogenase large subunit
LVNVLVAEFGLDRSEVRRRNLIPPERMPYTTPTGALYDEADYPGDLERALAAVGYDTLRATQADRRRAGDRLALGIGIACYNHMTTGGGGEEARVSVDADGSATVVTGTTSQGHGHATTWAQIASDALGIPVERIRVVEGDTDAIATGVGAVGSRSLQTAGMAIHRAATEVADRGRRLAAELLEAPVGDLVVAEGGVGFHVIGTPARTVTWAEVAAAVADNGQPADELTCGDFYDTEGRNTFPSGTHVAVVEVDTETGLVRLRRLVTVDDAGTVVNPMIVEGQLHGGIASAVGQVLGEVILHDDAGNQVTGTLLDYPIPTADQLPSFEVGLSGTASSLNALGFKGVGESGTVGATGAVHNAVVDAVSHLGVRHLDLPCTPERVWAAIEEARPASR